MARLWRYGREKTEGKYLVLRRDGTVPEFKWFVLGSRDPAAPVALEAYAAEAERLRYDLQYVADLRRLAVEYRTDLALLGEGDPDAPAHRKDDPEIIQRMREAQSAGGGSA